jgi:hypothetical protein
MCCECTNPNLMLRLGVLLLCVAALSPPAVDANLGGTAATTVPERSESSELLFKLAKQNSSYVVYPLDLLRLSTATKTRPKLMLNKIRPIGMILGEGRRRIWRRLTNTTNDGEISDEVSHSVDDGVLMGCLCGHAARQPSTPQVDVSRAVPAHSWPRISSPCGVPCSSPL